jgi:hypothetical protein
VLIYGLNNNFTRRKTPMFVLNYVLLHICLRHKPAVFHPGNPISNGLFSNGVHWEEENEVNLNLPERKGLKDLLEKRDWWKKTGMTEVTGGRR